MINRDWWTPRLITIVRWRSNGRIKATPSLLRATWMHLDFPSKIRRTWLNRVNSPNDTQSWPLIRDEPLHPTATPNFVYKLECSSWRRDILGFLSKSNYLDTKIWESFDFFSFLTFFSRLRSVWNQNLIEGVRRNHILNAIFIFKIVEWKAMNPAIIWIISSATLSWIACFNLNLSSFSIRFTFWIVD